MVSGHAVRPGSLRARRRSDSAKARRRGSTPVLAFPGWLASTDANRARVAERQTRWLQVPVSARTWGFKSPLAHQYEHLADLGLDGIRGRFRGPTVAPLWHRLSSEALAWPGLDNEGAPKAA